MTDTDPLAAVAALEQQVADNEAALLTAKQMPAGTDDEKAARRTQIRAVSANLRTSRQQYRAAAEAAGLRVAQTTPGAVTPAADRQE